MAKKIDIGGELHSVATGNIVADAKEIKYRPTGKEEKTQAQVNDELIEAVGSGGGVDARIASAVNAAKAEIKGDATSACDTLGEAEALISAETSARQSAISNVIGDAASDYNTLGKLEDKIQAEATRAEAAEGALDGRVDTLEDAVGTGGSIDSRISDAVAIETTRAQGAESQLSSGKADKATTLAGYGITDTYTKSETYTKTEVNGLVDTPHQEYETVDAYANLPATGSKDTIYRVSNYNGSTSQVDASVYSEYAWDGAQYVFLCVKSQIGEVFDISVYNNNAKYADLAAALNGGANIPQSLQKGGMSVKFVCSSDNKYVQYRLMATSFSTSESDWQGVDDEPTAGSDNLVKSGGVSIIDKTIGEKLTVISVINGHYIKTNGAVVDITDIQTSVNMAYAVVDCVQGDKFIINGKGASAGRLWCFIDANGNNLQFALENAENYNLILIAPPTATKLIINYYINVEGGICYKGESIKYFNDNISKVPISLSGIKGDKLSIIGSSISTFNRTGYKYSNYTTYYPNGGVSTPFDTYWGMLMQLTKVKLDINASYGGSGAAKRANAPTIPSFSERVALIGSPDTIIVELGTNDYMQNVDIGNYDFETASTDLSDYTFGTAYLKGIKMLMSAYPNTKIICLIAEMGDDYANVISDIASHYNLDCIDARGYEYGVDNHGTNLYPHPGKQGMLNILGSILGKNRNINIYEEDNNAYIKIGSNIIGTLPSKEAVAKIDGGYVDYNPVWTVGQYMGSDGTLHTGAAQWSTSAPIQLLKGQTISLKTQGTGQVAMIWLTDSTGSTFNMVKKAVQTDQGLYEYVYTANSDCYVALSGKTGNGDVVVQIKYAQKYAYKTDSELTDAIVNEKLYPVNAKNVLPLLTKASSTSQGITTVAEQGKITINGVSDSVYTLVIAAQGMLTSLKTGELMHVHLTEKAIDGLYLQVRDSFEGDSILSIQTEGDFVVPNNVSSLFVRLYIQSGKTFNNVVVSPYISKELSNESITDKIYNSLIDSPKNVLPALNKSPFVVQQVTIKAVNGELTFNGTSSVGAGTVNLTGNGTNLKMDWKQGEKYHIHFADSVIDGLHLQVMSSNSGNSLFTTQTDGDFVVPANADTLWVRIYMNGSKSFVNKTVHPYITKIRTNKQLEDRVKLAVPDNMPPMLTIIDDDGHPKFITDLLPIIQNKHVSISSAIYTTGADSGNNHMTWEQIADCYKNGAEILCHTYSHQTDYPDELTEEEIEHAFTKAKNNLLVRGMYGGRYLVYSGQSGNKEKTKIAASRVFDIAINSSGDKMNYPLTLNKYNIQRYRVESDYGYDIEVLKPILEECKEKGGWMVWMIHTSANGWNSDAVAAISASVDYARQIGIPVVSVDYVVRKYLKNL